MASNVTYLEIRTRIRQEAGMENSQFIKDDEMLYYVNSSMQELYDLLVNAYGNDYYVTSLNFSTTGGVESMTLPSDFYKLIGVDIKFGGEYYTLQRFNFNERNKFTQGTSFDADAQYRIVGNTLMFIPTPSGVYEGKLWYIPAATKFTGDSSTFDGINGWEEYIIIDTAIKCLGKEESDTSLLLNRKADMLRRIQKIAENRDIADPQTITDVTRGKIDYFGYGWHRS